MDYYAWEAVVNGEYVASYKTAAANTLTLGQAVLVNSYDGDKANGTESAAVAMKPVAIGTGTEISVNSGTLTVKANGAVVAGSAVALANDAKMVIYDVADKTAEVVDPMNLYAEDGHYYTVTTVATSNTNSAEKYVFVNDVTDATPMGTALSATSVTATMPSTTGTLAGGSGYTITNAVSNNAGIATVSLSSGTVTVTPVAAVAPLLLLR